MFMTVFGTLCNIFIVLLIRLKTCTSNVFFFRRKNVRARGFSRWSAPDRHWVCNFSRPVINSFFISVQIQTVQINVSEKSHPLSITHVDNFGKYFPDIDLSSPERSIETICWVIHGVIVFYGIRIYLLKNV